MKKNFQILSLVAVLIASCINCNAQKRVNLDKPLFAVMDGDTIMRVKYDTRGNAVWEQKQGDVKRYVYDSNGNLIEKRNEYADGRVWWVKWKYDSQNRLVSKYCSDGDVYTVSWDGLTCKTVDSDGRCVSQTYTDYTYKHLESESIISDYSWDYKQFDENGRVVIDISYSKRLSGDWEVWRRSDYFYSNNRKKEKYGHIEDDEWIQEEYLTEYFPNGKYDKPLYRKNTQTGEKSFERFYDNMGRMVGETDHGQIVNYSWNGNVATSVRDSHRLIIGFLEE